MAGEAWKKVDYRKKARVSWDAVRNEEIRKAGKQSTFYFTEFDDKWKAKDVYEVFKRMGEIIEVFIPRNRDKRGRRFGFARFLNIKDDELMGTKLVMYS